MNLCIIWGWVDVGLFWVLILNEWRQLMNRVFGDGGEMWASVQSFPVHKA